MKSVLNITRDALVNIKNMLTTVTVCTGNITSCFYYDAPDFNGSRKRIHIVLPGHRYAYSSCMVEEGVELIKLRGERYVPLRTLENSLDILALKMGKFGGFNNPKSIPAKPIIMGRIIDKESIKDEQQIPIMKLAKLIKQRTKQQRED